MYGGTNTYGIAIADVNGDGYPDVITGNEWSTNRIHLGSVDAFSTVVDISSTPSQPDLWQPVT